MPEKLYQATVSFLNGVTGLIHKENAGNITCFRLSRLEDFNIKTEKCGHWGLLVACETKWFLVQYQVEVHYQVQG